MQGSSSERKGSSMREAEAAKAYMDTIDRLEPDIAAIDDSAGWASIAISLKRIADALDRFVPPLKKVT